MDNPNRFSSPGFLSVVVPVYREEAGLRTFWATLSQVLDAMSKHRFEVLFIDDGSDDQTGAILSELQQEDGRITVVTLSRNFGQQAALTAGLDLAQGVAVIFLDADLQDPPDVIPQMVEAWEAGAKVVLGVRESRRENHWFRKRSAALYYEAWHRLTGMPAYNAAEFRLLDAQVVEILRSLPERDRYFRGLVHYVGFPPVLIDYERPERAAGDSHYSLPALWKLAKTGVFSFSYRPLSWTGGFAAFFVLVAFLPLSAKELLRLLALGVGGLAISLWIQNQYLMSIHQEAKQRPIYVVQRIARKNVIDPTHERGGGGLVKAHYD